MRIALTLEIHRGRKPIPAPSPPADDEVPVIVDVSGAQVEHAGWQPIGFQIQPTSTQE